MTCSICNHPKREEIERACLLRNYGDTEVTLRDIAKEYDVDLKDLQVHALMHIPLEGANASAVDSTESIAGKIKMREADLVRQTMESAYVTFKNIGDKINAIAAQHTTDAPTLTQITKPIADLYLGTSREIRECADTLMKMNLALNGEENAGLNAIVGLVNAIRNSDGDK